MSLIAFVTGEPFIFPSLGPTAFLLFYTPLVVAACPRNTICGHAIGAGAGYLSLGIFHEPRQLVILMLAVVFLVVQGFVINRLAGIPYPMWSPGQAET